MTTINKKMHTCTCGHMHQVNEREIAMYQGLVTALWVVFRWCEQRGIHEFKIKEIRHLFDHVGYARFGDWEKFGGLVYQVRYATYGLNMERCREFFAGKYKIPKVVYKDPISRQNRPGEYVAIGELPYLSKFLDENKDFIAVYRDPQPKLI